MRYKLVNFCEFDKDAVKSYCAIHGVSDSLNLGDITQVDASKVGYADLLTHGSPCTDYSSAGLQKGGDKESGTSSSLMWHSVDIIKHIRPKFVIWENVKNVLSPKHRHNFEYYISDLKSVGYNSYYKVMNARDYGVPQNRERIFIISIREDIDTGYIFPDSIPLTKTLKDIVQDISEINKEKWVLKPYQIENILKSTYNITRTRIQQKKWCDTLCARDWKDPKCIEFDGGIRKLTPNDYWRIQGFSDIDFAKAQSTGISNSMLYKQAGNSIALNVLVEMFKVLKETYPNDFKEDMSMLSLFSGVGAFEMAMEHI